MVPLNPNRSLALALINALILGCAHSAAADAPVRIMPLGDSITYGTSSSGTVGYRRPLYQLLIGVGYGVDFVGSQTNGSPLDFDRNHEGHSGWRADEIRDNLYSPGTDSGWLKDTPADVILLHIGTNDISQGQSAESTRDEILEILDLIDAYETAKGVEIWIVLARIVNRSTPLGTLGVRTTLLNSLIQSMAEPRIIAGDRLVVVDMESALVYPGDLADTVHPNDTGYGKMAAVWFDALEALLIPVPNSDHDGDADVDGSDLAVFIGAFGSISGDLNYEEKCDLNLSGTINEDDLALMALGFGY